VIANGDLYSRDDMSAVKALSGCTSVMLARPALLNCSVFDKAAAALRPQAEVIRAYIAHCIRYGMSTAHNIHQ
jgi:tRNA-dihydrouridine synthase